TTRQSARRRTCPPRRCGSSTYPPSCSPEASHGRGCARYPPPCQSICGGHATSRCPAAPGTASLPRRPRMRSTRSSGSKETSLGEPPPRGGPTRLVAILQSRTGGRGRDSRSSISPFFDGCHVMLTPDDQARDVQRRRLLDKINLPSGTP